MGLIYFDKDKMIIRDSLTEFQKKYIYDSTFYLEKIYNIFNSDKEFNVIEVNDELEFHIKEEHYNEPMEKYLEIHKQRTNKLCCENNKEVA